MEERVIQQLVALNQTFYVEQARSFAESRSHPQPGFAQLLHLLPQPCDYLLDVGCGEGRLGRYLVARRAIKWYTGLDFSAELLAVAGAITMGSFYQRDISKIGWSYGLGNFHAITCLAVLQHIPGWQNRVNLLAEMGRILTPEGRLFLSTWQFVDSERQRRKVVDWATVGLDAAEVEANDYLLTWQREGFGLRYVRLIDEEEIAQLAAATGLKVVGQFRSDGKEGNLSLYTVLERPAD